MLSKPSSTPSNAHPLTLSPSHPLILTLLLASALLLTPTAARAQDDQLLPDDRPVYIPGRLVVGVSPDATTAATGPAALQAAAILQGLDVQVVQATDPCVSNDLGGAQSPSLAAGDTIVQAWQVPPGQEQMAIDLLSQQPGIVFVDRDVYIYATQEPGQDFPDPGAAAQPLEDGDAADVEQATSVAYQVNDPLYFSNQWGPQRANFPRAWQLVADASALTTIRVAVIDSGVDFAHPDLALRLLPGKNYVDPGALPQDDSGHGTHVAGIIAAITNNGLGIVGSAPKVLIDPRKVLEGPLGTGSGLDVRYAICDAARAGDRVINMSFEVSAKNAPPGSTLYNLLKGAVDFAEARDVLLVAAGGNFGEVAYPALFEEVVAVSALTVNNSLASYSARGSKIEIAAPGGDSARRILSTWPAEAYIRQYCNSALLVQSGSAWYCGSAGTSMAAPYVVGAAALAWSIKPSLTADDLRELLKETATDVGLPRDYQGEGLLNAEGLVRRLLPSNLVATPSGAGKTVALGSAPYTTTIVLSNPSLDPLALTAVTIGSANWLSITNSPSPTVTGSITYGHPLALSAVVSPTNLAAGTYTAKIQLAGTRTDGTVIGKTITLFTAVGVTRPPLYMPLVLLNTTPKPQVITSPDFAWETAISPTVHALGASGSITVPLPFVFPFGGPAGAAPLSYGSARIYADGFVTFPGSDFATADNPSVNRCLPAVELDQLQGVFGWWADLDAGAPGAKVTTFRTAGAPDRFVVQYEDVASTGVTPAYRVSFQIVLYATGDVQLNYLQVPPAWAPTLTGLQPLATVGVQTQNGLFRNQVACHTTGERQGMLPKSSQSLRIKPADLY